MEPRCQIHRLMHVLEVRGLPWAVKSLGLRGFWFVQVQFRVTFVVLSPEGGSSLKPVWLVSKSKVDLGHKPFACSWSSVFTVRVSEQPVQICPDGDNGLA